MPQAIILYVTMFLIALYSSYAATADFSIYLVRHAEKQSEQKNPTLTACGQQRAEQLAIMLDKIPLKHIYSTNYNRTLATAKPSAKKQKLTLELYSPKNLHAFAQQLMQQGQTSLVVGHSNTTPQLTALLANQSVANISEQEYQHLYQVNVQQGQVQLVHLTQPLSCFKD